MTMLGWDEIVGSEEWKALPREDQQRVFRAYALDQAKLPEWQSLGGEDKFKVVRQMQIDAGWHKDDPSPSVGQALRDTAIAVPKVLGTAAMGLAAMPVQGLTGLGVGTLAAIEGRDPWIEAGKAMEEMQGRGNLTTTPEEQKAMENIGLAMKPFEMAGEGLKDIVRQTPLEGTIAEPIAGTIGEAAAMFGLPAGIGKARAKTLAEIKSLDELRGILEAQKQHAAKPQSGKFIKETQDAADYQDTLRGFDRNANPPTFEKQGSFFDYIEKLQRMERLDQQPVDLPAGKLDRAIDIAEVAPGSVTAFDMLKFRALSASDPVTWSATDKLFMDSMRKGAWSSESAMRPTTEGIAIEGGSFNKRETVTLPTGERTSIDIPEDMARARWEASRRDEMRTAMEDKEPVGGVGIPPEKPTKQTRTETLFAFPGSVAPLYEQVATKAVNALTDKFKQTAFGKTFSEFIAPTSTLPGQASYLSERYKALGTIDRAESIGTKIFDSLKGLSGDVKTNMFKFMDGQIDINALPVNVRSKAAMLKSVNNMVGQALVKRGMLSDETFAANQGKYIRYMYLKHVLGDKFDSVGGGTKMDLSYLKARKDLTAEQRKSIGLIEDISIAEPASVAIPFADMAKNDFFKTISENPNWTFSPSVVEFEGKKWGVGKLREELQMQERINKATPNVPEIQARLTALRDSVTAAEQAAGKASKEYVMLAGKQYGPLDGVMVLKPIARDLKPIYDLGVQIDSNVVNSIIDIEKKGMALFKVGKTAFNLPTVVRNTVSNVLQLNMSGVPIYDIPGYMIGAGRVLLEKGKTWKEMQRRGLFKTNWAAAEINEVLGAVRKWEKGGNVLADAVDFGKDIAKYYGKIDDFFKAAKYLEQIKMGASPETAAIEAHKWGMDYSMAHPAIKWSRRHLTPFISYQYKIAPLIAESIAKRPWVIAKYAMVPLLMEEAARRSMNLTEQDFQKLKKDLPLFIKKAGSYVVLPWKSKTGEAQWTNLEYFLPWQNFMAIKRDVQEGNYGEVASKDVGFGGPFIDIGVMLKSLHGDNPPKDPFTGRDVYNKLDTPTNKALALSRWLYERWAPQMFTEFGALGAARKAITGEKDRYGRQVSPENAALKMVGVNVVSPTRAQTNIEKAALAKDLRASLIRIVSDPTRDKTEKAAAMEDYKQRTRALMER